MANEFYHNMTLGFNAWFVVGPIFTLLMVLSGIGKYKLTCKSLKILRRDTDDWLLNTICVVLDAILHTMIILESGSGLVQYALNHLDNYTDPAWVPFIIFVELTFTSIVVWGIFFAAGKLGQFLRLHYLKAKRHQIIKQRRQQVTITVSQ